MISLIGIGGIAAGALFIGWLLGLATMQAFDSKRRYEQQLAEEAARDAKLAEGRANQAREFAESSAVES